MWGYVAAGRTGSEAMDRSHKISIFFFLQLNTSESPLYYFIFYRPYTSTAPVVRDTINSVPGYARAFKLFFACMWIEQTCCSGWFATKTRRGIVCAPVCASLKCTDHTMKCTISTWYYYYYYCCYDYYYYLSLIHI